MEAPDAWKEKEREIERLEHQSKLNSSEKKWNLHYFDFCRLISQAVKSSVHVFACVSVRDSVQGAEKRVETVTIDNCVSDEIVSNFSECAFSDVRSKGNGAPRCRGALEMSTSCCRCEPMETAPSLWR